MQSKGDTQNKQLIQRFKEGDRTAFDALFYAYEPTLYAYAMKLTCNVDDAKEVVQEVFLKVWERRQWIVPHYSFDSFLYTIAKNLVYNKAKHKAYHFAYKEYMTLYGSQTESVTENTVYFNELAELIQAIYQQLPPVRREVFTLSRIEGLSHSEIAEKLNTSTSNVKNHIHKALRFMKEHIQAHEIVSLIFLSLIYLLSEPL